jgi:site-specific recombinase XerD
MGENLTKPDGNFRQRYLSLNQVQNLINHIKDMRDKLLVKILYETGCSLGELVNIKVSDIEGNHINILDPNTKKSRSSRISQKLGKELALFIKGNNLPKDSSLIFTKNSANISEKRVRQLLQNYAQELGYGKINPQMLRYYHIAHAYSEGVLIENISSQLGIKKLRIFQILSELNIEPKQNLYDNFFENLEEKNEKSI